MPHLVGHSGSPEVDLQARLHCLAMVVSACNSSTPGVEARGAEVQGHPQPLCEYEDSVIYIRHYQERERGLEEAARGGILLIC